MRYVVHASKVVAGIGVAYFIYLMATNVEVYFQGTVILSLSFLAGLFLTVHGLFTGLEAAIAAGNDRRSGD